MSIRLQALPALADMWDTLVAAAAAQGIVLDIADYGGFRTAADTADILNYREADYAAYVARARAAGQAPLGIDSAWDDGYPRPIAQYGSSYHDYGAARDGKIRSAPAGMSGLAAVATVDQLAESIGLVTGASFGDPLHFQLDLSLADAAAEWKAYVDAGGAAGSSSSSTTLGWLIVAAAAGGVFVVAKSRGLQSWH